MNKHDLNNRIFVTLLVLMSCFFMIYIFRNKRDINYVDNRKAYKFTIPTINSLLSSEYQDNLNDTIADQMPKYNYFKLLYKKMTKYTSIETIKAFKLDKAHKYIKLGHVYLYNNYLLYEPNRKVNTTIGADKFNQIVNKTKSNVYLYFVNTDSNYNFETNTKSDVFSEIKSKLMIKNQNIGSFDFDTFEEYKKYFYKTDHHWNYVGSYKGYIDIAKLMNLKEIPVEDTICLSNKIDGSKIRELAGIRLITETSCFYTFDFPTFEIYISDIQKDKYGKTIDELKKMDYILYSDIYGADYDEIIFINKSANNNKKLLIYSNSISSPINKLLAANYKETYVIDERYYKEKNMVDYINDNKIDDVLILATNMLLWDIENW